ncbi:YitT family protein [Exiguobacterium flavidum]|uniref:YitT family protein n=1 Tax=Exiguobacterium flavidum TaxID=2184695 RepID=UPI000DF791DB|nr:YitT family protein [Exiguobacterium flavidum]
MTSVVKENIMKVVVAAIGGVLIALAMNWFLIPSGVYSTGFTGLAQILTKVLDGTALAFGENVWFLALNLPLIVLAWIMLGRSFTIITLISVLATTIFIGLIPQVAIINEDQTLNAVFGGVLLAVGTGITIKFGASTGGFDIVALIFARFSDRSVGVYLFVLNFLIAILAGALFGWPTALYTIVFIYVTSKVVDEIHTSNQRLTIFIVTNHAGDITQALHQHIIRGITQMPAIGTYSRAEKATLMMVIERHELREIERICRDTDEAVFINVVPTDSVVGYFRKG